jgi:3-oxoacyl-[acyl-carrier-protein] synthase-3
VNAGAFDLSAACSGYGYALATVQGMINAGLIRHALIVGAEALSRITDYEDRGSCILFGDGAGATVLSACPPGSRGEVLYTTIGADGANWQSMSLPGGGSREPASHESVDARRHYIHLRGREVFNLAVRRIVEIVGECVEACGLTPDDVDMIVPHQMNLRIMKAAIERLGLSMDKLFVNIDRYGNTGAATVPLALSEAKADGCLQPGDIVVLVTFGAGLTWSGAVLRW